MGAAAYNRGTKALGRQITNEQRPAEFLLIDDLNAITKDPRAATPFAPVHICMGNGGWWAEDPIKHSGFWYPSLRALMRAWRIEITAFDATEHTFSAVPMARA